MPDASIALSAYDPKWPRRFDDERRLLETVLAPWLEGGIHHVGSTAIPGVSAKPIIDMIAGVLEPHAPLAPHRSGQRALARTARVSRRLTC